MQKIAAQVGDKKLIKLRLYRQRTIERQCRETTETSNSRTMAQCQSSGF